MVYMVCFFCKVLLKLYLVRIYGKKKANCNGDCTDATPSDLDWVKEIYIFLPLL